MKLHLMSDVHMEHYKDHGASLLSRLDPTGIDAIVLAGDITSAGDEGRWREDIQSYVDIYDKVLYVPGNHEFYGSYGPNLMNALRTLSTYWGPRFTMLDHQYAPHEFMGHRFLGGTMWFKDRPDNWRWAHHIADFSAIRECVPWVYEENQAFDTYMNTHLKEGDIVITHHLPSSRSTPVEYIKEQSNRYFVYNCEELIRSRKPRLWLHGHTHGKFDYKLGDTRVVCNPRGYPNEKYRDSEYMPQEIDI